MPGDFTVKKKMQNWEGKSVFNQLSKNEMWCATDNYSNTCHTCAKGFLDSNFNKVVINKISNFHKIAPNFTYSQKW